MAVMEAYFDESGTHEGSPFVCVAGYLFEKGIANALDVSWRAMLQEKSLLFFVCQIAHTALDHLRAGRKAIRPTSKSGRLIL
jgi:hypothetical protein